MDHYLFDPVFRNRPSLIAHNGNGWIRSIRNVGLVDFPAIKTSTPKYTMAPDFHRTPRLFFSYPSSHCLIVWISFRAD